MLYFIFRQIIIIIYLTYFQVVTAHAVKVPVTKDLNANMPGFLPIHCIYHQLKSRMFTKHKVPIKAWIYK